MEPVLRTILIHSDEKDLAHVNLGLSIIESLSKISPEIGRQIIQMGGLEYLLEACKSPLHTECLLHAAVAIANLAVLGDIDTHQIMVAKQVKLQLCLQNLTVYILEISCLIVESIVSDI